ncbi:hypothetical protein E1B28_011127 [Marasmius oreades]|uniref:Uncharacterized protein n=1 Tax=Marasmius oreades TaxID=181124 RepID=A0A9P7RTL9_9AGAR|nr:uncharacterized protein E1B28_011127 [Marasmius oreades]KAG7089442.1 hypothetical protein E1B28_011127 [Marasmius oreades]
MVKELLSRPPKLTINTTVIKIGQILQDAGVMELKTFQEFAKDVKKTAPNYLYQTAFSNQDVRQWQEFSKEMVARYPQLETCYDYWPLQVYYDRWIKYRIIHRRRSRSNVQDIRQFSNTKGLELKTVQYVGRPPPKHSRPHLLEASPIEYSTPTEVTEPLKSPILYPDKCLACCRHPKLTAVQTMKLNHFLASGGLFDLLPVFNSFGIFHDGHLRQLCSLTTTERTVILAEFGSNVDVQTLLQHLDQYAIGAEMPLISSSSSPSNIPCMLCERHTESGDYFRRTIAERLHFHLNRKRLDFLAPVAVIYGIIDDSQLERTLREAGNSASTRKFLADHASVTPFYQQLLQIVLRELARHS